MFLFFFVFFFLIYQYFFFFFFFFQAEDGIRDLYVTGVQTCALPILERRPGVSRPTESSIPYFDATCTSICRGFAFSTFGSVTVRTPCSYVALMPLASTVAGSVKSR